jgi:fibronectin-binding autotransporter adhesin
MRYCESSDVTRGEAGPSSRQGRARLSLTRGMILTCLAAAGFALLPWQTAVAQSVRTWSVTSGTWSTAGSWVGGVPTASDTAYFSSESVSDSDATAFLSGNESVLGLSFNNGGSTTLQSNGSTARTLTLGTNGIEMNVDAGAATIGVTGSMVNLILNGTQTFTNNSSSLLSAFGTINTAGSVGSDLTIAGTGSTTLSGVISGGSGRVISLRKEGEGVLTLSGANTYTGGFSLHAGTVVVGSAGALGGAAGTVTINSGTLDTVAGGITTNANPQSWNGNFAFAGTGPLTFGSGAVSMSASRAIDVQASTLTVGGVIGDGGSGYSLTKNGAGTLRLNGANTFSGGLTLSAGTLSLGNNAALGTGTFTIAGGAIDVTAARSTTNDNAQAWNGDFTFLGTSTLNLGTGAVALNANRTVTVDASTLTVGGVISGAGFGITKAGAGDLTLSGTSNTYTGATTITGGRLILTGSSLGNGGVASPLGASSNAAGNLVIDGGVLRTQGASVVMSTDRLFTIGPGGATLDSSGGSTAQFNFTNTGAVEFLGSGDRTLTLSGGRPGTLASSLGDGPGGVTSLVKSGANTWTLSGNLTFTGGVSITGGRLSLTGTQNNFDGDVNIGPAGTLGLDTAGSFSFPFDVVNNGEITTAKQSGILTLSGSISGAGSINSSQVPNLIISNTDNSYTGITRTSANAASVTITVSKLANGGQNSSIGASSSAAANLLLVNNNNGFASLTYTGTGDSTDRLFTITTGTANTGNASSGIVNNGTGPLSFTNTDAIAFGRTDHVARLQLAGSNTDNNTFAPTISDNGTAAVSFTKSGAGTWVLTGNNTYTGRTAIQNGTLRIATIGSVSGSGNLGAPTTVENATIDIGSGSLTGTLAYTGVGEVTDRSINLLGTSGGAVLDQSGSGLLKFTSALTATGSGAKTLTLQGSTAGTGEFAGAIANYTGAGGPLATSVTKTGIGVWTLSGSNTYSGATTISNGVLLLSTTAAVTGTAARPYTVNAAGVLAAGFSLDETFLGRVATASAGVLAITDNSSTDVDFSTAGLTAASLGAFGTGTQAYTGTLTPNGTTYRIGGGGGTLDFQSALTGGRSLIVGGSAAGRGGTVILSSTTNDFTGKTTVPIGTLEIASLANVGAGNVSSLGAPTSIANGTIDLGSGEAAATLRYVGTGHTSDRVINLAGTTGPVTLDASGSGALELTAANTATGAGAKTFTLTGSSTAANSIGAIAGTDVNVDKTGPGTWRLTGASSFTGRLSVLEGTIRAAVGTGLDGSGVFGAATGNILLPVIGDAADFATGQAAVLLENNVLIDRGLVIAPLGNEATQEVILGSLVGTGTFGNGGQIRLGRDVTLQAATGGSVLFANGWRDLDGEQNPAVAFNVGAADNDGTVVFGSFLPDTISEVNVRQGTLRLDWLSPVDPNRGPIGFSTPVKLGGAGLGGTLNINEGTPEFGRDGPVQQRLSNLSFDGSDSTVTGIGTLRLFNSGSAAAVNVLAGTGHTIGTAVALDDATTFTVAAGGRLGIAGVISGSAGESLTKTGPGILELSGANTYAGATAVQAGTLVVNGALAAGTLTVDAGATLMGSGTIQGATSIFGTHAPGNSPGIETFLTDLTYTGGSSAVIWDLRDNTTSNSPLAYDQIIVGGNLNFADATILSLDFGGSGVGSVLWTDSFWNIDRSWTLFDVGGTTSGFSTNFSLNQTPETWFDSAGNAFSTARAEAAFSVAQQGENVLIVYTVPEPGSLALAALGLAAAWAIRRRA